MATHAHPEDAVAITKSIKSADSSVHKLRHLFSDFDAREATCYLAEDRDRLLSIVEAGCGGLDVFNSTVRTMLLKSSSQALSGAN